MENLESINQRIAHNLIRYRKGANLTQLELAQKINYSDKSVSKWESGNGVPDIYILLKLADLYGITVNDLVSENTQPAPVAKEISGRRRLLIVLLSVGIVWLAATALFVLLNLIFPGREWWLAFLYAIPASAIVVTVFSTLWKYKIVNFTSVSVIVWSVLLCVYMTSFVIMKNIGASGTGRLWMIFILGVPLQILEVLWAFFRNSLSCFNKKNKKSRSDDPSGVNGANNSHGIGDSKTGKNATETDKK